MEKLPAELQTQICSYLPHTDLFVLRHTSCSLASAAKPFLFETLTFHGDNHVSYQHIHLRSPCDRNGPISTYPVELASLDTTIDKVIELNISKYVETFQYSPRLYVDEFWSRYRDWVEDRITAELTIYDMDDSLSDAWDSDDEWGYVGLRREAESRRGRHIEEREVIAKAESYWNAKLAEQGQKKGTNHTALVRLFRGMPKLKNLQVMEWSCASEIRKHGIVGSIDAEVECQFSDADILNLHLETLSGAIEEAGLRIKNLFLPTVSGRDIIRTPVVQHLFGALRSLSLNLHNPTEMLGNYNDHPPSLRTLIGCARNTLERLEFNNLFCSHSLPDRGEHLLEKLWGDNFQQGTGTIVFPKLKHLKLSTLILYTPSLIKFLEVQPALQSAVFENVYLHTPGYSWADVAAALPLACHSLHINHCGGQTTSRSAPDPAPHPDIAYNQIPRFVPHKSPFPTSSGWCISESNVEREAERQACRELGIVKEQLIEDVSAAQSGLISSNGLPLSELLGLCMDLERRTASRVEMIKDGILAQESADYERL